jgi:hypothetical protein
MESPSELIVKPSRSTLLAELAEAARVMGLRLRYRNWTWIVEPTP